MIQDRRETQIQSTPEIIFDIIENMPIKFPVYKILETKPFLFLRILFVDGFKAAMQAVDFDVFGYVDLMQTFQEEAARAHLPDIPPKEAQGCHQCQIGEARAGIGSSHGDDFFTVLVSSQFQ